MNDAIPTAAEFKARHRRFDALDNSVVDLYLLEASGSVATTWSEVDYKPGIMYLAAHLMVMEGALSPTGPAIGTAGFQKRVKAGEAEVEYFAMTGGVPGRLNALYGGSIYGQRYLELAARNGGVAGPAILVV